MSSSISFFPFGGKGITVPLLVISIVVDLFLLVDGSVVFGSLWSEYQSVLILYLAMAASMFAFVGRSPQMNISIEDAVIFFVPSFVFGSLLIGSLVGTGQGMTLEVYILEIIFQVFVVALTEEMLFRGVLINYIGVIPQGILFGLFHLAAYQSVFGINWLSIIEAMIMGIAFGYVVKVFPKQGIAITWGLHSAWNVALLTGVFGLGMLV